MSDTKTKWDSIVSGDELSKARTLRSKTFIEAKKRPRYYIETYLNHKK